MRAVAALPCERLADARPMPSEPEPWASTFTREEVCDIVGILAFMWALVLMVIGCRDEGLRDDMADRARSVRVWARQSFNMVSSSIRRASLSISDGLLRQHGAPTPLGVPPPKSMV